MKRLLSISLLLALGISAAAQGIYKTPDERPMHPTPPPVPAFVVFCGDTIRFDTTEKYERMDRELMAFTYMHTTSSLMLKRSGRWFPLVQPILVRKGIPEDFKYLMVIESNLDPTAVSLTGAAGLWQFTRATAQEFGLEVNSEIDERYNEEKETAAACTYLLRAYDKFNDWATVAASYNCGLGGMAKRIEDQRQDSFFDLLLPEETSRYVYRILVAKMFFEDPGAFGYQRTEPYPQKTVRQTVTTSDPIPSLVDFAERYGVTYAELKRANLWLRSDHITNKAHRSYSIVIPR